MRLQTCHGGGCTLTSLQPRCTLTSLKQAVFRELALMCFANAFEKLGTGCLRVVIATVLAKTLAPKPFTSSLLRPEIPSTLPRV